mmetsp:Transcript_24164/g.83892  ORF Transcript_24164/g.83892 Transcript_24164/m.83892 type:complete len:203 (+) Transcript_24164:199-807(+)
MARFDTPVLMNSTSAVGPVSLSGSSYPPKSDGSSVIGMKRMMKPSGSVMSAYRIEIHQWSSLRPMVLVKLPPTSTMKICMPAERMMTMMNMALVWMPLRTFQSLLMRRALNSLKIWHHTNALKMIVKWVWSSPITHFLRPSSSSTDWPSMHGRSRPSTTSRPRKPSRRTVPSLLCVVPPCRSITIRSASWNADCTRMLRTIV